MLRLRQGAKLEQPSLFDDDGWTNRKKGKKREAEDRFAFQCTAEGLPPFERNYRFAKSVPSPETRKPRQWELDFAWVEFKVYVECEGIVFRKIGKQIVASGRHVHPDGFREDCIKYAHAALLGWTGLRFECRQIIEGTALGFTMDVLASKGWIRKF